MRTSDVPSTERDAELILGRASKAEFSKEYDLAFRTYIRSAEAFLHLSRSRDVADKKKIEWKGKASKALERAELIKKLVDASRSSNTTPYQSSPSNIHLTPIPINHFSQQEQFYVLKKGNQINELSFPPWEDPVKQSLDSSVFRDPEGQPVLSPEQQRVSSVWRRVISDTSTTTESRPSHRISPQEVLQHIITDCSFCASISVCLEHSRRFGSRLAESALQHATDASCLNGRYDIRMLFNGSWRRVLIDDQLPCHPVHGTLMCMSILPSPSTDMKNGPTNETLWPSLLEKSYMKLMGGYDFPGSNSSIDLHALIGWIPEYIDLKRSGFEREKNWERIQTGFSNGHCMVTLGTGRNSQVSWRDVELLPSHSYAVIDIHEDAEERSCTILDSWVRSEDDHVQPSRVLQIPWSEVLNTFDGVYLSWDPNIWDQPLTFHGMWNRTTSREDNTMQLQLEFKNIEKQDQDVWVLLTRHVADTRRTSDFVAVQVGIEELVYVKETLYDDQQSLSSGGTYTNSTQILSQVKLPGSQSAGAICVSASYEGDAREVGFTISVYGKGPLKLSWIEKEIQPSYTQRLSASFFSKNAGGNCTYPSFMDNPQYRLTVHKGNARSEKAKTTLTLQGGKDMPMNVAVVWSQGDRISLLSDKDIVASSGAYSYGLARITKLLTPGEYTIVASTFEPQYIGPFILKVDCSHPVDLKPIPQEGAGMYSKIVRGSWEGLSAAGAPSFKRYADNPVFLLELASSSQVLIRLQLIHHSSAVALNVTCYPSVANNLATSLGQNRAITSSGAYDDAISGVVTPKVTIGPGRYYIVPSTYSPRLEAPFKLIVHSSVSQVQVSLLDMVMS
ncbi:hypothetical protein CPB83DRAFT_885980 [Crepidotus variabilis]|uniref:Calpain catalytic domain-containing protein n=1 Tax=Crepidotus variabilis TaxID=179855 RepID=A0A9P6JLM8_9AGAR|nr:hypothetical protein CPB83DRAFT_885980 [Crepidotus variabilis]